jgi:putative glutamine amidotransferase
MTVRIGVSYLDDERIGRRYLEAIQSAGAEPVVLATSETCPPWPSADQAREMFAPSYGPIRRMEEVDGLLLTGGGDIDPMLYQETMCGSEEPHWPRDHVENAQFHLARRRNLPILGICRGMQFVNVALGGSLIQDLATSAEHRSNRTTRVSQAHFIHVDAQSFLAKILADDPTEDLTVGINSRHHQGVGPDQLASALVATARSCVTSGAGQIDVLEAVETPGTRTGREFVVGVQWHPERVDDEVPLAPGQLATFRELSMRLFRAFVAAAARR